MTQRPAAPPRRGRGFTLIETLVVLTISVGLVILMAQLYRAVGHAALSLKGGNGLWTTQSLIRYQLLNTMGIQARTTMVGSKTELQFFTWHSRSNGKDGQPVLAGYRYDPQQRALIYHEHPLPAWWDKSLDLTEQATLSRNDATNPEINLLSGIEDFTLGYMPADTASITESSWYGYWNLPYPPRLIRMQFSRAGQTFDLWFDLRATDV